MATSRTITSPGPATAARVTSEIASPWVRSQVAPSDMRSQVLASIAHPPRHVGRGARGGVTLTPVE